MRRGIFCTGRFYYLSQLTSHSKLWIPAKLQSKRTGFLYDTDSKGYVLWPWESYILCGQRSKRNKQIPCMDHIPQMELVSYWLCLGLTLEVWLVHQSDWLGLQWNSGISICTWSNQSRIHWSKCDFLHHGCSFSSSLSHLYYRCMLLCETDRHWAFKPWSEEIGL